MQELDLEAIERAAQTLRKLRRYCRLQVEGLERVPKGPAIIVGNHTGWTGLDYANLFISIYDDLGRVPRVAVHPSYFRMAPMRPRAARLGFFEVSVQTATRILDDEGLVCFFPEAEEGNFKPIWKRYQLQRFKPGFARVALASLAPIVPVVIVGGEDANPTLGRVGPLEDLLDIPVPIPLNILPFPVKWRIAFCEPVDPAQYLDRESPDEDVAQLIAQDVRATMQAELERQLALRGNPFL